MPKVPLSASERTLLGRVARLGLVNPKLTVAISLALLALSVAFVFDMPISTSRYKLVADDNPYQARMVAFFERFGYPDSLVMVVGGGDAPARREVVDALTDKLEQEPELSDRTLGRIEASHVAELLLLFKPDALKELRGRMDGDPAALIEGGLPSWIDALNQQLEAGLEGDEALPEKDEEAGLEQLASLLRALDARLGGGDASAQLPGLRDEIALPKGATVDDHGYLTTADGQHHLIAMFPTLPGMEGSQVKPLVDKVRAIRDATPLGGVEAKLTGLPAFVADEVTIVQSGLTWTSVVTSGLIMLLLLLAFRSKRYTILSLIPLGVGLVLTLAVTRWLFGGLNLITSSFVPVLLALGIDFGVYVLSRYGELVRTGGGTESAIHGALVKAGPGIVMGAVTTMAAFLMTTVIEFTAYSELGVITAVGLALMVAVTFLLLPALILLAGRGEKIESPELGGVNKLPALVRRGKVVVPAAALVLSLVLATFIGRITFNARYFDFLPEHTETTWGLERIEADPALSPVQANTGVDGVEAARELADKLRALETVGSVQSATDLLPPLDEVGLEALRAGFADVDRQPDFDALRQRARSAEEVSQKLSKLGDTLDEVGFAMRQADRKTEALDEVKKALASVRQRVGAMPADAPQIADAEKDIANMLERAWTTARAVAERGHYLPTDLPVVFRARFVSKDGQALAVFANPAGDIWDADQAAQFAADVQRVDPSISGLAVTVHEHMRMIKEGFAKSTMLSVAAVFVVLLIGFRRIHDMLFAMVPVAFAVVWMLGVMGVAGMRFDVANIVALPLITGVGIDAGAHMMHRWRQSADAHGGIAHIDEVLRGTGAAVLMASLTTATGFAALMLADYGGMKTLGLTMTIGIIGGLCASLLLLPALLVLVKKAQ